MAPALSNVISSTAQRELPLRSRSILAGMADTEWRCSSITPHRIRAFCCYSRVPAVKYKCSFFLHFCFFPFAFFINKITWSDERESYGAEHWLMGVRWPVHKFKWRGARGIGRKSRSEIVDVKQVAGGDRLILINRVTKCHWDFSRSPAIFCIHATTNNNLAHLINCTFVPLIYCVLKKRACYRQ